MSNTTPRAPTHTSMGVPCAQQLCLMRRIVLAATGSLYRYPRRGAHRYTRGRRAYASTRDLRLLSFSLPLDVPPRRSSPCPRLSFYEHRGHEPRACAFVPRASAPTTENCIIMRPGPLDNEGAARSSCLMPISPRRRLRFQ